MQVLSQLSGQAQRVVPLGAKLQTGETSSGYGLGGAAACLFDDLC